MIADAFGHSFTTDQQMKIMQQIQSIDKRLSNNSYSNRANIVHNQKKYVNRQDFSYFSGQCQQLFKDDEACNNNSNRGLHCDDSLFDAQNEMLLDNSQYEKYVGNFKQFQTNKFRSQDNEKIHAFGRNKMRLLKIFESQKNKALDLSSSKYSQSKLKQKVTKNNCESEIGTNIQKKPRTKMTADSKIKKQISNKQNILLTANLQKQESFLKLASKKTGLDTQPGYQIQSQQAKNADSRQFQIRQKLQKGRKDYNQDNLNREIRSRNKYSSGKNDLQCTFKPSILKRSHLIAQTLQPSFERLTGNIGAASKSQIKLPYRTKQQLSVKKHSIKRMEQLSQPRRLKTTVQPQQQQKQDDHKFRPNLTKRSLQHMANCTLDVAERNKLWLEQRQAKINRMKVEEQEQKVKKQTGSYTPKINEYKGESEVHLSRFAKQGISSYFERVSMAKQKNSTYDKKKPELKQQMTQNTTKTKKKTYAQAVKQLHKKILSMNI